MKTKVSFNFFPVSALLLLFGLQFPATVQQAGEPLSGWTPGTLDIHEISTGCGSSTFIVLPDGRTMLYDAGELTETNQAWP